MLKFGKQSFLKQKWEVSLKSSSLFVRIKLKKLRSFSIVVSTAPLQEARISSNLIRTEVYFDLHSYTVLFLFFIPSPTPRPTLHAPRSTQGAIVPT